MSDVLEITPTESVEVPRSEPAVLEVKGIYAPGPSVERTETNWQTPPARGYRA